MTPTPAAQKTDDSPRRAYRPSAERRVEIIAAAQAEFVRANFSGARTREIAEAAGVNQATLFKLFPSKEVLFEEAVMRPLVEAMQSIHGRVEDYAAAATPDEMGRIAEGSTAQHIADMERILPLLTTALFSDLETGRQLFRECLQPLIRARGKVLEPLARDGIDPEFLGLASFGMMFAVALQRWFGTESDDPAATARQFNRLFTGGFARDNSAA